MSNENEERTNTIDDTMQSAPRQSTADTARSAKNKYEKSKKALNKLKKVKSMAPLVTIISTLGIILVIIFLTIGYIGFFITLPGLTTEKIVNTCKDFWTWLSNDDSIEVDMTEVNNLANYLEEMGYDIVGYGFAQSGRVSEDSEGNTIIRENDDKEVTEMRYSNLYAYILANERTYTITGKTNDALFEYVTFGSIRKNVEALVKIFNYGDTDNTAAHYGMLQFDESLGTEISQALTGFRASIDRKNNQLVIDTGRINVSRMTWDLTEWTARYGKPVELSLALHLSTMAPDFVYNFCMDDDLQTKLLLATQKATYQDIEYSYMKEGAYQIATKEDVDKYYDEIKEGQDELLQKYNLFADTIQLSKDNVGSYIAPVDILFDTSVISIQQKNENGEYGEKSYYKAVDADGNIINFNPANNYEVKLDEDNSPYFEVNENGNIKVKEFVINSLIEEPSENEIIELQDGTRVKLENLSLNDFKYLDKLGILKDENGREGIVTTLAEKYLDTLDNLDNYINHTIINNKDKFKDNNIEFTLKLKDYDDNNKKYTFNTTDDETDYPTHNIEGVWEKIANEATSSKKPQFFEDVINKYNFQDLLQEEIEQLQANSSKIDEAFLSTEIRKYLSDINMDLAEFIELHDIFDKLDTEFDTYVPYIQNITHHWYKDVYFIDEDDDFSVYDMEASKTIEAEEFEPSDEATSEKMSKFLENGKFYYTGSTSNDVSQLDTVKPKIVSDEPWHYKVKNWLAYGYYFIYDGTEQTAINIELAKSFLKKQGLYDESNPLLLEKYAAADDTQQQLQKKGIGKEEIDSKAKEINKVLEDNGYSARLQKIDFEKDASLTAFSILEGVHTEDSDIIYEDLKNFMIEMGYFTYADFESIETDVFEWLIPDYTVYKDEWPDSKYEKIDTEYGSYIRSKSSVDAQKEKETEEARKKEEEEGTEEQDNETEQMATIIEERGEGGEFQRDTLLDTATACWQYIVDSEKYTYAGASIPITSGSTVDCSAFVSWILYEYGYEDFKGWQHTTVSFMDIDFSEKYGWEEIDVAAGEDCSSKLQPGDILVRDNGEGGAYGHVTFIYSIDGDEITVYDCGSSSNWVKANREGLQNDSFIKTDSRVGKIIRVSGGASVPVPEIVGYEAGLDIVMPENGKIIEVGKVEEETTTESSNSDTNESSNSDATNVGEEDNNSAEEFEIEVKGDYVIIEFEGTGNGVDGWKMRIEGFDLDTVTIQEGTVLNKGDIIGRTTESNMKLLLYDDKDAIIDNIEDYFVLEERESTTVNNYANGDIAQQIKALQSEGFDVGTNANEGHGNYAGAIKWKEYVDEIAPRYDLDPNLVIAMIAQESGGNPNVNGAAVGLMCYEKTNSTTITIKDANGQDKEETDIINRMAAGDVELQINVGCAVFKQRLDEYNGNVLAALQGYNYGPGGIKRCISYHIAGHRNEGSKYCDIDDTEYNNYLSSGDIGWLEDREWYTNIGYTAFGQGGGDSKYIEHILRFYKL